jgi:hypothetical protein
MVAVETTLKQDPKDLLATMLSGDFSSVYYTAVKDCGVPNEQRAQELMVALFQWFAVIPSLKKGEWHAVLESDVDQIFHALILNTKVYLDFCFKHLGEFVHHTPLDGTRSDLPLEKIVSDTIFRLEKAYGSDLAPDLREWRRKFDEGTWAVSCVKDCPVDDAIPNEPSQTVSSTVIGQVMGVNLLH